MTVMIFKRTLFEEKQRAFNSLLSDPNLLQGRHIIKTLALNQGLSNPWMDSGESVGDLSELRTTAQGTSNSSKVLEHPKPLCSQGQSLA
jgi:hypothetical protein